MARWITVLPLLPLTCCTGCYSRQLLPAMTICIHDQQDRPVAGLSGNWSGYATEDDVREQPFVFDADSCARIQRYELHTNVLSFAGGARSSLLPHQGGLGYPASKVRVSLPAGYEVDESASGLKRNDVAVSGGGISWDGWDDMDFYLAYGQEITVYEGPGKSKPLYPGQPKPPDEFVIELWEPASRPNVHLRLVLRPNTTTQSATFPATGR